MSVAYGDILSRLAGPSSWSSQDESSVLEPYTYITANPGKDFRSKLMAAFNTWINVPQPKLKQIAKVVSMLHNASLMIDDIEDDSQLRRGQPVTHKIYGIPQTINTANYIYFLAYQELLTLSGPDSSPTQTELIGIITSELLSLHRGQGLELLWRDSLTCPTEEQYIDMVNDSEWFNVDGRSPSYRYQATDGLWYNQPGLVRVSRETDPFLTANRDYVPLVNLIGVYFQIRDDYMNLQSKEVQLKKHHFQLRLITPQYTSNKGFAEDLTEGKFSFPVVHGIQADKSNRQLLSALPAFIGLLQLKVYPDTLQKRPKTPTLKSHAISYLEVHTKSFEYTRSVLASLGKQMRAEVARLGGNEGLEAIMNSLALE
ncbi:hypothetical protein MIND_00607300 [Mycena indigotica]|uniref:(2E,6E)-farnesyl diphosphate synthase n=1 Tax=Mycena indigotica TaxID=2126181 RepID=A0A8H6SSW5_9AGAR|nr:uncharacterized protein MIND_00607300 [Mycena indigotica]KAF7303777.1 hypothetical protein MIND_00607300 [Mycena indigotica]